MKYLNDLTKLERYCLKHFINNNSSTVDINNLKTLNSSYLNFHSLHHYKINEINFTNDDLININKRLQKVKYEINSKLTTRLVFEYIPFRNNSSKVSDLRQRCYYLFYNDNTKHISFKAKAFSEIYIRHNPHIYVFKVYVVYVHYNYNIAAYKDLLLFFKKNISNFTKLYDIESNKLVNLDLSNINFKEEMVNYLTTNSNLRILVYSSDYRYSNISHNVKPVRTLPLPYYLLNSNLLHIDVHFKNALKLAKEKRILKSTYVKNKLKNIKTLLKSIKD